MGNILVENTTFGIRKTWIFSLLNISVTLGKLLSVSESRSTHLCNGNCCSITLKSRHGSYKMAYLRSLHRAEGDDGYCSDDDHDCNDDGSLPPDFFSQLDKRAHLL